MSALTAETASTSPGEDRRYSQVRTGYTPFLDGDLLVAKITPCFENGKIAQATLKHRAGFGSTEFHVVRPRPGCSDARYLLHFLRQDRIRLEGEARMTGSAGQRRVPEHFLAQLDVPLPPLPEQRRIAEVLDRAESLRAKRRAALAQLDTLTQAIFFHMFGDPAANPRAWPKVPLGSLIASGPQNGLYKPAQDYGSGTPIVRIDAFYDGVVTKLARLKRVRISAQEQALFALRQGDILINRVNSREYLGKSALVPALSEPTVFESNMMRFDVDRDVLDPNYMIAYLQTSFVRGRVLQSAKDAINQSSINQKDVKAIPVTVPPLPRQQLFSQRLRARDRLIASELGSLAALDVLLASLRYRAFRGEL